MVYSESLKVMLLFPMDHLSLYSDVLAWLPPVEVHSSHQDINLKDFLGGSYHVD